MFVCCGCGQVEVSTTSWSLIQRSPTDCGASLCVIKKPREQGGHSPRWAAEPQKKILYLQQGSTLKHSSSSPQIAFKFFCITSLYRIKLMVFITKAESSRNNQHYTLTVPLLYSIHRLLHVSAVVCHHQGASWIRLSYLKCR
jgi:hypothetical protein